MPATTEVVAHLEGVHRHYQMGTETVRALDGIDLDIRKGNYLAIMGRSGSGKSTMLNILGLLDRPTEGEYTLEGSTVSTLSDPDLSKLRGEHIGFIFQSFNLIPQLTVLENLEVPLFYQNRVGPESKAKAEELAIRVGLDGRLHHRPTELSGGQQQRVAIARSLAMSPDVMLFDEVTAALDPETVKEVLVTIQDLAEEGMTCILVTHEMGFAREVANHIYFTDFGLIVEHGPPATFFDDAKDPRTKEFLSQIL
jgi:polar amino acid transport system ATP-binding protein